MADSDLERTEAATPKRRQEAREKGDVPRSQELTTAFVLVGSAVFLSAVGGSIGKRVAELFTFALTSMGSTDLSPDAAVGLLRAVGWRLFSIVALFGASMAAIALVVAGVQARGILTLKPLEPNWSKLDVVRNAKEKFFGVQTWVELFKSLGKLLIIGVSVYWALDSAWAEIIVLVQQNAGAVLDVIRRYVVRLLLIAGGTYLVLGILDYVYQIWKSEKNLRMTKEDVRKEMKEGEVDPMVKQAMRAAARERMHHRMFEATKTADVVLKNPTHIAVALKYDQGRDVAPVVVAMGQELIALRIIAIAEEAGVPVEENRPVARALFASCEIGKPIPPELYAAVIEIYAFIIQMRNRSRATGGRRPSDRKGPEQPGGGGE